MITFSNGKYSEEKIKLFRMIPQGCLWINLSENLQNEYLGNSFFMEVVRDVCILYRLSLKNHH